jgi:hypothetical protein
MCLNSISYADIQHLQEPEQLFAYADAYRSAAAAMCQQMTSDAAHSTWPNAVVVLMLTAHAVELFLKGALLKRSPAASFRNTHNIDFLSENYRLQFEGPSFEWDIPFNSGLTEAKRIELMAEAFPSLTESEIKEMSKEMGKKQAASRPPSIVYRYPTDGSGTEWRGNEGFEPHSFLSLLDHVENDFKRIKTNLLA